MIRTSGTRGIVKICFLGFLLYIFLGTQNLIPLPAVAADVLMVLVILVSSILDGWKLRIRTDERFRFAIRHFITPAILIFVYSIFNQLIQGLSYDYLQNTATTCVRWVVYYFLGIVTVSTFGSKTVEYLLLMGIAAYIPAITQHFQQYGAVGGLMIMLDPEIFHLQTPLEIHTLTYIFGFMALYYAYRLYVEKRKDARWLFFLSLLMTVIGIKRIVLASLVASILMMVILNRIKPGQRYGLMRLGCMVLIASSVVFLHLVHSGILESVVSSFGVEANDRFFLWGLVQDKYSMSPFFLGHGISFGMRIMEYVWQNTRLIHSVALHCDVLRVYLGLGFVGSMLYWYNYFYATMRRANRVGSTDAAMFAFTMTTYLYINSMTSNEGINPITNGMFFMVLYTVICDSAPDRMEAQRAEQPAQQR